MVEVYLHTITLDPVSQMPIMVLKSKNEEDRILPIWIGVFEANSLVMNLQEVVPPRPMTYDLTKNIIESLGASVDKVVIEDIKDSTYYATIFLKTKAGQVIEIDSRPSDAVNIAVRFNAPIYVREEVMEKSKLENTEDIEKEKLKEWLESIRPEDFEIGNS